MGLGSELTLLVGSGLERLRRPRRHAPRTPARVLVAHELSAGATLMLTALLAKLRHNHRDVEIVMTVAPALEPLYQKRPYGVSVCGVERARVASLQPLLASGDFDLAILPHSHDSARVALACGARWIVAFGEHSTGRPWTIDELRAYPNQPATWGDMVATLVDGLAPPPFRASDWPDPDCLPFAAPTERGYAVLHAGASSPLAAWPATRWRALAAALSTPPVVLAGADAATLDAIDPEHRHPRYIGLDWAQSWRLLRGASLLVCTEGDIASLGLATGVPTVALYGPGTPVLAGAGSFWRTRRFAAVTLPDFPCRDEHLAYGRKIDWVRNCERTTIECAGAKCMQMIDVPMVTQAIARVAA